ncbi:MAG TPA: protein kinase [Terracidiphilus sp.]
MNQERYQQIDALVEAALQMDGTRRLDFLQRACGSDQDLLERVSALLKGHETAEDFLEKPAFEAWARDVAEANSTRTLEGRQVGRYRVLSHLGAGGIGEVWLARDTELSREVALKFLSPELAGDSDQTRRFRREARAASSLNHPNLVTIFDIGEFEGQQFIAQEYVPGKTVREVLAGGPFSTETAAQVAAQIAGGLQAAHAAGVIHRDIKPENIMIRPDGVVKVLDFGIARLLEDAKAGNQKPSTGLTRAGIIVGTARYMSPEQARGLPVDGRSDLFSLGVVLYEMVTGAAPFSGATPSDILAAILTHEPAPLSRSSRNVPSEFDRVIRRCLAKDPAARYPSAQALEQDLRRMAVQPKASRSNVVPLTIAASLVVVLAVLFAVLLRTRQGPRPVSDSMRLVRLSIRGEPSDITISRDGKLLAYVLHDGNHDSVWTRDISGSNERSIVRAAEGEVSGVMLSPDNAWLDYRQIGSDGLGDLFRVSLQGGTPERIISDVAGAAAFSPDGKRIAFFRVKASTWEASLMVSGADGSGEFALETVHRPKFLDERGIAWSPDGEAIAYFAGDSASDPALAFHLVEVSLRHPGEHILTPQLWWPRGLAWAASGNVLIVNAATPNDLQQIWMVRHDSGEITRLTNDLANYSRVSVTDDGKSIVSVQSESSVTMWATPANDNAHFTQIGNSQFPSLRVAVGWAPDGGIVYNDAADGFRNIWRMDADGANARQLTQSPTDKDELVVTRDGRYIVYQQDPHIWRVKSDGTEPVQLTHGRLDVHPDVSPDGKSVYYASFADWTPGIGGEPTLWRVSIDGGEPTQISRQPSSIPTISPDGKQIGCIHFPGKDPRFSSALLAVTKADGAGGFTIFQQTPGGGTTLAWSPDGTAIDFVMSAKGVQNIWRQPLNGGPPVQITHFERNDVIHFSRSRDGRLLCTRGNATRTPIMIQNFR